MLPETNRTIYLKITLTQEQTNTYRELDDETIIQQYFNGALYPEETQVLYNVEHES